MDKFNVEKLKKWRNLEQNRQNSMEFPKSFTKKSAFLLRIFLLSPRCRLILQTAPPGLTKGGKSHATTAKPREKQLGMANIDFPGKIDRESRQMRESIIQEIRK